MGEVGLDAEEMTSWKVGFLLGVSKQTRIGLPRDMSGVWSWCWFFYPTVSDGIPQLAWQIVHSHGDFREAIQCQYNFLIKRLRPGSCAIHTICLWKVFQQVSTCELERISLG